MRPCKGRLGPCAFLDGHVTLEFPHVLLAAEVAQDLQLACRRRGRRFVILDFGDFVGVHRRNLLADRFEVGVELVILLLQVVALRLQTSLGLFERQDTCLRIQDVLVVLSGQHVLGRAQLLGLVT